MFLFIPLCPENPAVFSRWDEWTLVGIDENRISRYETAEKNRIETMKLKFSGMKQTELAKN